MSLLRPPDQDADALNLTIRFSASLPDLLLSIPTTTYATTTTLKQLIRARLPPEYVKRRIRLIHSGKALPDDASLHSALKRPLSRAPSRIATPILGADGDTASTKEKGKAVIRDPPAQSRIYIHCSIGDVVLSPSELAEEATITNSKSNAAEASVGPEPESVPPAPALRGFDRLLSSGFTQSEIQSLRLQFMAVQAHTHTPDAMPSPNTLRNMEDHWLDNSHTETGMTGITGTISDEDNQAGALDDMLWGTAMGFFWPVGCLLWACREEGIWSQRRKMAVVVGVLLNVGLGFVRYTR